MASGVGGLLGAGVGALIGSQPDKASAQASQGVNLNPMDAYGQKGLQVSQQNLDELTNLTAGGPGQTDVNNYAKNSRSLADLLQAYSQSGGLPSDGDINSAMGVAKKMFDPQQTALNQSMVLQTQQANQLAARLGRSVDDPILQAKMRTNFMNQQGMLDSNTGAYGQQLALALPGQRAAYAGQANNVLSGLATQAFSNRAALMSMGNNIFNQQQNFQLASSQRYGTQDMQAGGGLKGALQGALAGFGGGSAATPSVMNMFGGGGAQTGQMPMSQQIAQAPGFQAPVFGQSAPGFAGASGAAAGPNLGLATLAL